MDNKDSGTCGSWCCPGYELAAILVLIGLVMLLTELGYIGNASLIWPALLIVFGLYLAWKNMRR